MDLFVQYQANGEVHDATDANSKPIAWRCVKCGDYAILGQATDTGPHAAQIAVEVRAAELAANPDSMRGCGETDDINECEQCGVDDYDTGTDPASPAQWAGYLARAIATHQDPTE